jgi:hypothetical protein
MPGRLADADCQVTTHGATTTGYAGAMSESPTPPLPAPDDAPEAEPFEPSVTNPDADGIEDEPS